MIKKDLSATSLMNFLNRFKELMTHVGEATKLPVAQAGRAVRR